MTTLQGTPAIGRTEGSGSAILVPGSTGWTIDRLDDPEVERLWLRGRYEIVEGVLTIVPPAWFDSGVALQRLIRLVTDHVRGQGGALAGEFATEADLILGEMRLPVVDAVFLTAEQMRRQEAANADPSAPGRGSGRSARYGRLRVPPTLAIESISLGHEAHDRRTKYRWYEEAGIPHYWILDAHRKTLDCFILDGGRYRLDQAGAGDAEVRPAAFPGLVIALGSLWGPPEEQGGDPSSKA